MNVRLTLVSVLGVLALCAAASSSVAQARGGCASKSEFKKVERGMTIKEVGDIFGTNGRIVDGSGSQQVRQYKTCGKGDLISIGYLYGRVANKVGDF